MEGGRGSGWTLRGQGRPGEATVEAVALSRSGPSSPVFGEVAESFSSRGGPGLLETLL